MQIQKKQVLGLGCLAVASTLAFAAFNVPTYKASASETKVQVNVKSSNPNEYALDIVSPDPASLLNYGLWGDSFTLGLRYNNVSNIKVVLKDAEGNALPASAYSADTSACTATVQTCNVPVKLNGLSNVPANGKKYGLTVTADGPNGVGVPQKDMVFTQNFAVLQLFTNDYMDKTGNKTGDPVMTIHVSDPVEKIVIMATDGEGNVLTNNNGSALYTLTRGTHGFAENTDENGLFEFAVPLWEYGAPAGSYTVTAVAYGADDTVVLQQTQQSNVEYTVINTEEPEKDDEGNPENDPNLPDSDDNPNNRPPEDRPTNPGHTPGGNKPGDGNNPGDDNPDKPGNPGGDGSNGDGNGPSTPPNTGSNLFRDLNISNADYIVTGLVAFGLVSGFAVFLIIRRSKRS